MSATASPTALRRSIELLATAAAYYVVGRLSLLLAIPPGYATAVWPAAGLALAAVLLLGFRVWPAVLLGSFLVNVPTSFAAASFAAMFRSLPVPLAISAGATLQALLGAALIRRFIGTSDPLAHRPIRFLLFGGPIASVVSASIGVSTLFAAGLLTRDSLLFSWTTWWVGDCIGTVLFAPLVFQLQWDSRRAWIRRQLWVSLPLLLTSAIVVLLFFQTSSWEQRRIQQEFQRRTGNVAIAFRSRLDRYLDVMHSIESLYAASASVSQAQFHAFVSPIFGRTPGIVVLGWDVWVPDVERSRFESEVRATGLPGFAIRELDAHGALIPARRRGDYVVARYIEPRGNESALGYDVASERARFRSLSAARDRGRTVASPLLRLVQQTDRRYGLLVFQPIYRGGLAPATPAERRARLRGFIVGAFLVGDIVTAALHDVDHSGIDVSLDDVSDANTTRLFPSDAESAIAPLGATARPLSVTSTLIVAGRRWSLTQSQTYGAADEDRSWQPWLVLACGLLFTSLLGALLIMSSTRAMRTEALIALRTIELEREVAERRRAEAAVREANGVLNAVLDGTTDLVFVKDLDGRYELANRALCELLQRPKQEVLGRMSTELLGAEVGDAMAAEDSEVLESDKTRTFESSMDLPGGRRYYLTTKGVLRDAYGKPRAVFGIAHDITGRRLAEDQRARQNAEQLEVKDQFFSHVSHELGSPIATVYQFVTILQDGLAGELNAEQHDYLQIVRRNTMQLKTMIGDLLEVTRAQTGKLSVRPQCLQLGPILEETVTTYRGTAGLREIGLSADFEPELPEVLADPARVRQILTNLLDNALKFTPAGGSIRVQARSVSEAFVELSVFDDGCGIPAADQSRIFEHLFQSANSVKQSRHGLGLGLYICRDLVNRQGGEISVESEVGAGATFRVTFPTVSLRRTLEAMLGPDTAVGPLSLITVEFEGVGSDVRAEAIEAAREAMERSIVPSIDVLLPWRRTGAGSETSHVIARCDVAGSLVMARRLESQLARCSTLAQDQVSWRITQETLSFTDVRATVDLATLTETLESRLRGDSNRKAA